MYIIVYVLLVDLRVYMYVVLILIIDSLFFISQLFHLTSVLTFNELSVEWSILQVYSIYFNSIYSILVRVASSKYHVDSLKNRCSLIG